MTESSRVYAIALATVAMAFFGVAPAPVSSQHVQLQEWDVPWEQSRPRDPYVAPDGRVWFVGQRSHYAAVLDPETGDMRRYELPEGAGPHNLIVDDDGIVWYAGNRRAHIGRLDPGTGDIVQFPMPDPAARDPHTLIFDSKGDIWFTVQSGNFIGKMTMPDAGSVDAQIELVPVPEPGTRPYGIVIDADDRPWVALFGTDMLATVDPESMKLRTIPLPRPEARPRRIGLTPDQQVWYVDYAGGMLGRYNPASKKFTEWPLPGGENSRPYGMATDNAGRVWFVETGMQPNRFVGFNPGTEEFFSINEVESGGGTIRHMYYDEENQSIWFGADTNTVGRATIIPHTDS